GAALRQFVQPERQLAESLTCRVEDRIRHRRRDGRSAGFADAAWRGRARYHVHFYLRHLFHAQDVVAVEIALHDTPVLDGDLAFERRGESVDDAALDLLLDDGGVHCDAAIHRAHHSMHFEFVVDDRSLGHHGGGAADVPCRADALAVTGGHWLRPA